MRAPTSSSGVFSGIALAVALVGCSGDEVIRSVSGGTTSSQSSGSSTGSDTSSSTGMGGAMPTASAVREVFNRPVWGTPANNLLADGDFEHSVTTFAGQYGWIGFTDSGATQVLLRAETGGICRTGLTCGVADKGTTLFGRGTAPANKSAAHASIFARSVTPPAADQDLSKYCDTITRVKVLTCDTFDELAALAPAAAPGADGYCEYSADVPGSDLAMCMYVTVKTTAIFDNATLLPSASADILPKPLSASAEQQELHEIGRALRSRMRFGKSKPERDIHAVDPSRK